MRSLTNGRLYRIAQGYETNLPRPPASAPVRPVAAKMTHRIGRVERANRRALIAADGLPVRTRDLLKYAYSRIRGLHPTWRYWSAYRAASKFAVRLSKPGSRIVWAPNAELARLIGGDG
jgi:hypothetical protein